MPTIDRPKKLVPAAKYRRISDDREGRELGIDRQDEDLDEFAARHGLEYVASYVDNDIGASTRSKKPRPDFKRMLADARSGRFKVICTYTSARLTRRPREHEDLIDLAEQCGIRYEYIRSPSFDLNTAAGRRVARILAANDAGESEDISERVSRARLQQAQQGRFGGGARRFGHELDGTLKRDEAAVVSEAAALVLSGVGLSGIVKDLNARGLTAPRGGRWTHSTLRDMLLQPRVAGLMSWNGDLLDGRKQKSCWAPILDRPTWEAVCALLNSPDRVTTPGPKPKHLLSHLAVCGHASHPEGQRPGMERGLLGGYKRADGSRGPRVVAYRCSEVGHLAIVQAPTDEYVEKVAVERLSRPDAVELLSARPDVDVSALAVEANSLRARIANLGDLVESGDMGNAEFRTRKARLSAELAAVEADMTAAAGTSPLAGIAGRADAAAIWDGYDLARKRAAIDTLMEVVVLPAAKRGKGFDPDRVQLTPRGA